MIAAWAFGETWMKAVSVPEAPSLLSELPFSGAAPIALDVAMALALDREMGDDAEGVKVGDGTVKVDIAVAPNGSGTPKLAL